MRVPVLAPPSGAPNQPVRVRGVEIRILGPGKPPQPFPQSSSLQFAD